MAIVKKVIGKVPIGRGDYSSTTAYYAENTVTMYGMSFRALTNISTGVAPAVADATGKVMLINTDKWQLMSGTPDGWNITAEIKDIKDRVIPEAVAEGIAEVVANAPSSFDTLKEVADYIASDKTKAAEIETAISDLQKKDKERDEAITHNTGAIANNLQAIDLLVEEVATKAPKVGYAPDLKVDFAKELVGRGVAEPQVIGTIRPTGLISIGDGNATIEKVKGKSVVWNQLLQNNDFYQGLEEWSFGSGVSSKKWNTDGSLRVTYKGGEYNQDIRQYNRVINIGNKVMVSVVCNVVGGRKILHAINGNNVSFNVVQGVHEYIGILEVNSHKQTDIRLCAVDIDVDIPEYIDVYSTKLIDLTQIFGAGNEPTTIEEFNARKPLGVSDDYNEGEIISYDGANELKSVGFNAFNGTYAKVIGGQQYHALGNITSIGFTTELGGETTEVTLDSEGMFTPSVDGYVYAEGTDICIHLTHTYTPEHTTKYEEDTLRLPDVKAIKDNEGNQLFPYGLLSAGSVHDEITATKAVKRIGFVNMGTLEWNYNDTLFPSWGVFYAPLKSLKKGKWNVGLCSHYSLTNSEYDRSGDRVFTMTPYLGERIVIVRDSRYTDKFVFRQVTRGVMFYYELEEPIEVDLPEPLNLTYDAWDFGTEELVAEGKTTPLNADIVYQFNAVDRIRENTAKNQALEAELAELKMQLTQLTQVTNEQDSNA